MNRNSTRVVPHCTRTQWFDSFKSASKPSFRLFALPYAGGGIHVFQGWPEKLPEFVDFCPIHLPGRGKRFHETMNAQLSDLIEDLASAITPYLDLPYGFFGHSMGAMIAYEVAHRLREATAPRPGILIVSGRRAPHIPGPTPVIHQLPAQEFISELRKMNGTPIEVLDDSSLMEVLLPVLRADFALSEGYHCTDKKPLDCAIIALGGLFDSHVKRDDIVRWKEHTTGRFSASMLPGDHFFIHSSLSQVLSVLNKELYRIVQSEVR